MKWISLFIIIISLIHISCVEDPVSIPAKSHISIIQPVNNESVSDSISIMIEVSSSKQIIRVEVFIDHNLEKVFTKPPYVFFWYVNYYEDGSQHIIEAKTYDKDGDEMTSKPVIVNVYRFMPSYLQAFMNSDSIISLNWVDNSKIELGFEIEHSINDTVFAKIADVDSNVTNYSYVGSFDKYQKHFFRVRARSHNSVSGYSNIALAQIVLQKPTNLNVDFTSDTTATIQWEDNTPFETSYRLEIRKNNVTVLGKSYPSNAIKADIEFDFQSGYYYQFTVAATDTYRTSLSDPVYKQFYFYSPDSLSIEQITETKVRLKWKNKNFFNANYKIERKINNGNYFEIGTTSPSLLTFDDDNLDTANTYYYRVSAFTRVNLSPPSTSIKVELLPYISFDKYLQAPSNVSAVDVSKDGNTMIVGGYTQSSAVTYLLNAQDVSLIRTFFSPDSDGILDDVGISYDNSVIAASSTNNKYVKIWNSNDGSLRNRIYLGNACFKILFHPNKSIFIMASYYKVIVFNYNSGGQMFTYTVPYGEVSLAISNSSNALGVRSADAVTKIIDLNNGSVIREFNSGGNFGQITFTHDDKYIIESFNNVIRKWDIASGSSIDYNLDYYFIGQFALHPTKNQIVFCGTHIFDFEKWKMVNIIPIIDQGACMKFFPSGNKLISFNGISSQLKIWKYGLKWQISLDY